MWTTVRMSAFDLDDVSHSMDTGNNERVSHILSRIEVTVIILQTELFENFLNSVNRLCLGCSAYK